MPIVMVSVADNPMKFRSCDVWETQASSLTLASPAGMTIPSGFLRLSACPQQWLDRKLGYFGQDRFVFFYYEPRGEEVIWNDGRGYGFGCGAWRTFNDEVAPLANRYGVNLGGANRAGDQVLLIDRVHRQAYFADRDSAQAFVANQGDRRLGH